MTFIRQGKGVEVVLGLCGRPVIRFGALVGVPSDEVVLEVSPGPIPLKKSTCKIFLKEEKL